MRDLIEEPEVLSSLPRSFDSVRGKTWTGTSYVLSKSRKRRRAEISIGTDGQSLNCYAVKSPRLISSHALSPQSYFTAAPAFVLLKQTSKFPAQRFAYAAIRDRSVPGSAHKLFCFYEFLKVSSTLESAELYKKATVDIGTSEDPVICIEPTPARRIVQPNEPPFDLVVVQKSGQTTSFIGNLQTQLWTANSPGTIAPVRDGFRPATHVLYAVIHNAADAANGLLKAHPDVLAKIQPVVADGDDVLKTTELLFTVKERLRNANMCSERYLSIHALHPPSAAPTRGSGLRCVAEWHLPTRADDDYYKFELDLKTGLLQQISKRAVSMVSFARLVPTELWRFNEPQFEVTGVVHLRGPLVMISTQTCCGIYNTRYQTLLARHSTNVLPTGGHTRKRKHGSNHSCQGSTRILQYFPRAGRAVGLSETHIVSLPINLAEGQRPQRVSLLVDSLGQKALLNDEERHRNGFTEAHEEFKTRIGKAIYSKDMRKLDELFFESVVDNAALSTAALHLRANHMLGVTFGWHQGQWKSKNTTKPILHIRHFAPDTFRWLSSQGFVAAGNVDKSLRQNISMSCSLPSITPKDLVDCLSSYDPSLVRLTEWIELHPHNDAEAIVHALSYLLQSFDGPSQNLIDETRLLQNAPDSNLKKKPNHLRSPTSTSKEADDDDNDDMDETLDHLSELAQTDLETANTFLEDGLQARALAIRRSLETLATCFAPQVITKAFARHVERRQLLLLVDLLRFDLTEAGWCSSVLDYCPAPNNNQTQTAKDNAITPTIVLLNSTIDALGSTLILSSPFTTSPQNTSDMSLSLDSHTSIDGEDPAPDAQPDTFLPTLRHSTSSILSSIQESVFFSGFLKDFLRFSRTFSSSPQSISASTSSSSNKIQILARQSKGERAGEVGARNAMLPLGLGSAKGIERTRNADGGALWKRSRRDMKEEGLRRMGVYEFGRIFV